MMSMSIMKRLWPVGQVEAPSSGDKNFKKDKTAKEREWPDSLTKIFSLTQRKNAFKNQQKDKKDLSRCFTKT